MITDTETLYEQSLAARVRELTARRLRRLLVTSTAPTEGKSSVVLGLGRALAQSGTESVLLVDANPIRPDLHSALGVSSECGLSDLLAGVYFCELGRENPIQFGLGDWLEILRAQAKTGELLVSRGDHNFCIRFAKGSICSISGGDSASQDAVGERLVRLGKLGAAQRDDALRIHERTGRPLGHVLRMLNCVTEADLSQVLVDQAGQALRELIALRQPSCRFNETAEAYRPATGGRTPSSPESAGIDELVTGTLRDYLESPFLTGQMPAYISDTALPNLKLLSGGSKPSELNAPPQVRALGLLLERLGRIYDIILIDSAEVGIASPTAALAGLVDGALLVVKADQEDVGTIRAAVSSLREAGGQVLGVVLSQGVGPGHIPGSMAL
jgi:Mrp family chromosome partitioning ATPase